MNTTLLLRAWPYGALALLAAGLGLRCVMARRQSVATDLSEARDLFGGGRPWRASLVLLISGHIVALLAPAAILSWNAAPVRLYVLEAAAFLVGVTALGGCIRLIWHHLQCCRGTTAGQLADSVLLSLVLMTLVSGLLTALFYRWASSWECRRSCPTCVRSFASPPSPNWLPGCRSSCRCTSSARSRRWRSCHSRGLARWQSSA